MRIQLVCPYAWDAPGGVQTHVRGLASFLRLAGHTVEILAPATADSTPEAGVRIMARAVRVPYRGTVAPIAPWPGQRRRIREAMIAFGPDLLHVHEPLAPSTSRFATLVSHVPVVATFHAYAERSRLIAVGAPLVRHVWNRCAARIAVSAAAAEFVSGPLHPRPRIVPNGVETAAFARARPRAGLPQGRRVTWVNRLDPQKGFRQAVTAFAEIATTDPEAVFVVAGEGRDAGAIDTVPESVRRRIAMLGSVGHDEVPGILAGSAAFVSPATGQESFGVALVEAMTAGVPVVASDIAGYREVIRDGVDGLLVPPGDAGALAAALASLLRDRPRAQRLAAAGRSRAGRFDWSRVGAELEAVYQEVAGKMSA